MNAARIADGAGGVAYAPDGPTALWAAVIWWVSTGIDASSADSCSPNSSIVAGRTFGSLAIASMISWSSCGGITRSGRRCDGGGHTSTRCFDSSASTVGASNGRRAVTIS